MANYNSNKVGSVPKFLPYASGVNVIATYTWGTTGLPTLTLGDTITGPPIPAGTSILDVELDTDRLDGGGGALLTLNVGDAANPTRYMSGVTAARSGGVSSPNSFGWTGFQYAATTNILITVAATASGAVPANATIRLVVSYTADP